MKALTSLFLIISAAGAFALSPPVPKNFIFRSPKNAEAVRFTKTMSTMVDIPPPSGPTLPPVFLDFTKDINFFGCDVHNPTCRLYDSTHLSTVQPAGIGIVLRYTDQMPPNGWTAVATFYPPPEDRVVDATGFSDSMTRPFFRVWQSMSFVPEFAVASGGEPKIVVDQAALKKAGLVNFKVETKKKSVVDAAKKAAAKATARSVSKASALRKRLLNLR